MWGRFRQRVRLEDAAKHLLDCQQRRQPATVESLAGAVGLSRRRAFALVSRMQAGGLLELSQGALGLTADGQRLALRIVRAHRLWETYLAREAGMPLARVHHAADRAEHRLTSGQVDALADHLGHPPTDPHGDPIPTPSGLLPATDATALGDWPLEVPARIVHIEDEPPAAFAQIQALGLRPGSQVRVLARDSRRLLLASGPSQVALAPIVADCIQVAQAERPAAPADEESAATMPLDRWPLDQPAVVVGLDPALQGISRRRLLDLGVTPGTTIEPVLQGMFGGTRAYRVRGTTIALRGEQTREVRVRGATPKEPAPPRMDANERS